MGCGPCGGRKGSPCCASFELVDAWAQPIALPNTVDLTPVLDTLALTLWPDAGKPVSGTTGVPAWELFGWGTVGAAGAVQVILMESTTTAGAAAIVGTDAVLIDSIIPQSFTFHTSARFAAIRLSPLVVPSSVFLSIVLRIPA